MNGLLFIDAAALLFFLVGFHLAFRRKAARRWLGTLHGPASAARPGRHSPALENGDHEAAPVFLMVGVMMMAFSFTAATFANLIVYYAAHSPN